MCLKAKVMDCILFIDQVKINVGNKDIAHNKHISSYDLLIKIKLSFSLTDLRK